ncbi:DNA repair protein Mus81, putative [Talaromyces stipitatus ATCC 10500]|uniref:Crossover junction endonuclease MUS81 n=1 Tax=Talaromyces stipitatus (strain ATCC 10500 / CBS 375.48 / QM 6759 / NRRL 1006) TaxID=441959 RepID=B8M5I2_TALSN|nr:DNA repair protein Mus81, putative [Talaromyces stipitatus ATCC 10500]EED19876.1 DNA repair protein Mus81, putative [Talaromyces stipitatus ATCC 10500]
MADTCANPLLLGWIKEWLDQARERNSKGFTVYKKAYESMKACPLEFSHPSEAIQLNGLGPKLCDRLTEKLKEYCEQHGLPMPELPNNKKSQKRQSGDDLPLQDQPAKKVKKAKPYVPALRSGAYALILGLSTMDENSLQGISKAQLIEIAQPHSDSSFTAPSDPTKFYTAWNSMKTLIQKELVYEHGRPLKKYALTEEGWECARRIRNTSAVGLPLGNQPTLSCGPSIPKPNGTLQNNDRAFTSLDDDLEIQVLDDIDPDPAARRKDQPRLQTSTHTKPIILPPNSFTIELILDSREVRARNDRDYISKELEAKGITTQVRALELGDAMWVAKCTKPDYLTRHGEEGDEVMLDWIVERKRLDDLIGSIKDGRFHEQKFRLRRSGISNVVYLIEEFAVSHSSANASGNVPNYQDAVASAIASTQVVNGYFVKKTKNLDDTIRYLARMTFLLRKMYGTDALPASSLGSSQPSRSSVKPKSVALIPSSNLSSSESYLTTLRELRSGRSSETTTYGVSFSTFSALTSKSDTLTLRDVFLKMLMCTRGITGDKALEIQRHWRTPRAFMEAFEIVSSSATNPQEAAKAKEKMLTDKMGNLIARKRITSTLSRKVAEIWGEKE